MSLAGVDDQCEGVGIFRVTEMEGAALVFWRREGPTAGDAIGAGQDGVVGVSFGGGKRERSHAVAKGMEGKNRIVVVVHDEAGGGECSVLVVGGFKGDGGMEAGDQVTAFGEEGEVEGFGFWDGLVSKGIRGIGAGRESAEDVDDGDRLFEEISGAVVLHPVRVGAEAVVAGMDGRGQ